MIIQPAKDKLLPHLVVDDFYDKYLLEGVWKELDFYSHTQMQSVSPADLTKQTLPLKYRIKLDVQESRAQVHRQQMKYAVYQ